MPLPKLLPHCPQIVEKIGVVVNETPESLAKLAEEVGLTGVQLHGDEPAEQLSEFRRALTGRKLIKTLQVRELLADLTKLGGYLQQRENIDTILLDSGSPAARGGTGVPFDWKAVLPIAQQIKEIFPVIIGGGLSVANVGEAIRLFDPWGSKSFPALSWRPARKTPPSFVLLSLRRGSRRRSKHLLLIQLQEIKRAQYDFYFHSTAEENQRPIWPVRGTICP